MKGYIYILNGKVVINPEGKLGWDNGFRPSDEAIKEWESNCIEAENAFPAPNSNKIVIESPISSIDVTEQGSQVEHDGPVITKII